MKKLVTAAGLAAALWCGAALMVTPTPASAEIEYPWCAQYSGGFEGNGGTNCGFSTWKQCWDTVSGGRIGDCYENPRYVGVAAPVRHKKRHAHDYPG